MNSPLVIMNIPCLSGNLVDCIRSAPSEKASKVNTLDITASSVTLEEIVFSPTSVLRNPITYPIDDLRLC